MRLVVALALTLVGWSNAPAWAGAAEDPDLATLTLPEVPPGFVEAPEGAPNTGELTVDEYFALSGGEPPEGMPSDAFEVFVRQWDNEQTLDTLVIALLRFRTAADADSFQSGIAEAADEAGPGATFDPGYESANGVIQEEEDLRLSSVAATKGRYGFILSLARPATEPPPDNAQVSDLGRAQLDALPAETGADVVPDSTNSSGSTGSEAASSSDGSAAYRAGRIAGFVLIAFIGLAVALKVVKNLRRREATDGPGSPPQPARE